MANGTLTVSGNDPVVYHKPRFRLARWLLPAAFGFGLLVRLVCLPNPGVSDMVTWKALTLKANQRGVAEVYRGGGGVYQGRAYSITYPPASVYVFYATGKVYGAIYGPSLPDYPAFNLFLRLPGLGAELAIATLLLWYLRHSRQWSLNRAGGLTLVYWLNPAVIENTSILGYTDSWFTAAALAALVCLAEKKPEAGAAFLVLAIFFKPQPVFIVPLLAVWVWRNWGWPRLVSTALAGLASFALLDLPYWLAGRWLTPLQVVSEAASSDSSLSAQQNNLWWVGLWLSQLARYMDKFQTGLGEALGAVVVRIRTDYISSDMPVGPFTLQTWSLMALALFLALVCLRLWHTPDPVHLFGGAALAIFGYTSLGVQAHENHLFAFLPLFVLVVGVNRQAALIYAGVSLVIFFNLLLFEGVGGGLLPLDRRFSWLDFTVINSLLGAGLFGWLSCLYLGGKLTVSGQVVPAEPEKAPPPAPALLL